MDWFTLLLAVLATYRLTRVAYLEEGPFSIAKRLRDLDPDGATWVGRGFGCPWCISFWVGPAMTALLVAGDVGLLVVSGLACSTISSIAMTYGPVLFDRWRRK